MVYSSESEHPSLPLKDVCFPSLGSVRETPNPSLVNHILFLTNTFTCYYMFVCFESGVFLLCFPPESKEMNT